MTPAPAWFEVGPGRLVTSRRFELEIRLDRARIVAPAPVTLEECPK